jgi:hypothetical protein
LRNGFQRVFNPCRHGGSRSAVPTSCQSLSEASLVFDYIINVKGTISIKLRI